MTPAELFRLKDFFVYTRNHPFDFHRWRQSSPRHLQQYVENAAEKITAVATRYNLDELELREDFCHACAFCKTEEELTILLDARPGCKKIREAMSHLELTEVSVFLRERLDGQRPENREVPAWLLGASRSSPIARPISPPLISSEAAATAAMASPSTSQFTTSIVSEFSLTSPQVTAESTGDVDNEDPLERPVRSKTYQQLYAEAQAERADTPRPGASPSPPAQARQQRKVPSLSISVLGGTKQAAHKPPPISPRPGTLTEEEYQRFMLRHRQAWRR